MLKSIINDDMQDSESLYSQLEKVKNAIPSKYWKSYNLLTIENLIYHLNELKNERVRNKVGGEIKSYLDLVESKTKNNLFQQEDVKDLDKYIYRISDPYKYDVGFVLRPSYPVLVVIMIVWFFFLRISFSLDMAAIITLVSFVLIIVYYSIKTKQKKIY